jgi:hypothetical protein
LSPFVPISGDRGPHCQHDNPTIGQDVLADWLADRFGIAQRSLLKTSINP